MAYKQKLNPRTGKFDMVSNGGGGEGGIQEVKSADKTVNVTPTADGVNLSVNHIIDRAITQLADDKKIPTSKAVLDFVETEKGKLKVLRVSGAKTTPKRFIEINPVDGTAYYKLTAMVMGASGNPDYFGLLEVSFGYGRPGSNPNFCYAHWVVFTEGDPAAQQYKTVPEIKILVSEDKQKMIVGAVCPADTYQTLELHVISEDVAYGVATYGTNSTADVIPADFLSGATEVEIEDMSLQADEEDLTSKVIGKLHLKDREATTGNMGYVILRKDKTFAEQVTKANTIYEIRYEFDLNGSKVTIPKGCTLKFEGGSINNGVIIGTNTIVNASNYEIFKHGHSTWRGYISPDATKGFQAKQKEKYHGGISLSGTWDNDVVLSNWCGLNECNTTSEKKDVSHVIRNHILLYKRDAYKIVPKGDYMVYGRIDVNNVDFQGSTLHVIEDYTTITDSSIVIPDGYIEHKLISYYGFLNLIYNDNFLKNVTIVGNASKRDENINDFGSVGVVCGLSLNQNHNSVIENVVIDDFIECGVSTGFIKDVIFRDCTFSNLGEHGIYDHCKEGSLVFERCKFLDFNNRQDIVDFRGASALIKFAEYDVDTYDTTHVIFKDCYANNEHTLNNRFCYETMPHRLDFINFKFGNNIGAIQNNGNGNALLNVENCDNVNLVVLNTSGNLNIEVQNSTCKGYLFWVSKMSNSTFRYAYGNYNSVSVEDIGRDYIHYTNCTIEESVGAREVVTMRVPKLICDNCHFIVRSDYEHRGADSISLVGDVLNQVEFNNCQFDVEYRYIFGISNSTIFLNEAKIHSYSPSYGVFKGENNILRGIGCYGINFSNLNFTVPIISLGSVRSLDIDYTCTSENVYYKKSQPTKIKSGDSISLNKRYYAAGATNIEDWSNFVQVVPVDDNWRPFTYTIEKASSTAQGSVTISFDEDKERMFSVIYDTRHYNSTQSPLVKPIQLKRRGTTEQRPTLTSKEYGYQFFDTTLNRPIWWDGTKWVDMKPTVTPTLTTGTEIADINGTKIYAPIPGANVLFPQNGYLPVAGLNSGSVLRVHFATETYPDLCLSYFSKNFASNLLKVGATLELDVTTDVTISGRNLQICTLGSIASHIEQLYALPDLVPNKLYRITVTVTAVTEYEVSAFSVAIQTIE